MENYVFYAILFTVFSILWVGVVLFYVLKVFGSF